MNDMSKAAPVQAVQVEALVSPAMPHHPQALQLVRRDPDDLLGDHESRQALLICISIYGDWFYCRHGHRVIRGS